MRRVVSCLLSSVDGAVGKPQKWVFGHFDAEMMVQLTSLVTSQDAVLLGRATYEGWSEYWPTATDEPFASFINTTPKYVASATLGELTWQNSTLIDGSVANEIARLKRANGKDIGVHGSVSLVQSLLRDNLIDALRLAVVPVIVGAGPGGDERLFGDNSDMRRLRLVEAQQTSTGVMLLTYHPRSA